MECVALTGISDNVMKELKNHVLRTIEIRSPQNFFAVLKVNAGDYVFITHASAQDVTGGTVGVLARVLKHQISTHSILQSNEVFYEEREMTMARIQLEPRHITRITKVLCNEVGEVMRVIVDKTSQYEAR
ncbi:MAG: DUF473 domain-containing protein [Methanosarcinaceae archaeon]|nr:DUF473 domain-containing protein [Methanosarcinaceae archaeon]MDF1533329.1 DUF473 domain-containing protein [Methanosarcinaceae archaeon]